MQPISLYFHIPFCTRKCDYCHFFVLPDKPDLKQRYLEALVIEWQMRAPVLSDKEIVSVYFGGGTPALIGPPAIYSVLEQIHSCPAHLSREIEITLEANPENITLALMKEYADAGINRVSIGIQSLDDALLQQLGRTHGSEQAAHAVLATAQAGIENISIDLMYDLPRQSLQTWEETLKKACELPISHLSLYNLTIEPHTVFFKHRDLIQKQVPDEETSLAMYQKAIDYFENAGLHQYEISAFARNNHFSRHNVGYWTARTFLGLGPSAFSYWEGSRFRNICSLSKYESQLKSGVFPVDFQETLDQHAKMNELLAVQLRLLKGVDITEFQIQHGQFPQEMFNTLEKLCSLDLLKQDGNRFSLTPRGVLFYDTVAEELI